MKETRENTDMLQHDQTELPIFDFGAILVATNNFSPMNKLGQGGFGSVYKVTILFLHDYPMHYKN